ncbi:MAG: hypothetical protein RKN61_01145 [Candidatus Accumulibacter sp.]|uniref:hypothetical protein n=1 Tax=Accumulibacter sp. TaxID=2053492 RepID=UPI0028783683|nr:hypothetical protein [Accumulibacter sp.]MDS4048104.1 hypothetical protein [Accumulibacter sp.]
MGADDVRDRLGLARGVRRDLADGERTAAFRQLADADDRCAARVFSAHSDTLAMLAQRAWAARPARRSPVPVGVRG